MATPAGERARIVTLTMNPALDITTDTARVVHTEKLRCGPARYDAGGGGINVAKVASVLGASVSAVFPSGGLTGRRIVELVAAERIPHHTVAICGTTRENLTVDEQSTGRQYRFVLPGPALSAREQADCLSALRAAALGAGYVVASGSLPPGIGGDFQQDVSDVCREVGAKFVLDTSGHGLTHATSGVYVVKPSVRELRECTGRPLTTELQQIEAARRLVDTGRAEHVLVSRGADDALLVSAATTVRVAAPSVAAGSGVGAGDALVAGTVVGLTRGWPLPDSVRLGMAAGAAMLLTPGTAACRSDDVWALFDRTEPPVPVLV